MLAEIVFTGIVRDIAQVIEISYDQEAASWYLRPSKQLGKEYFLGASVSVSGACLTVEQKNEQEGWVKFFLSKETIACTRFCQVKKGDFLNVEPALCVGDSISGHFVTGHVDAAVQLLERKQLAQGQEEWFIQLPPQLKGYAAPKGSITLDGVSLTVNNVLEDMFSIFCVPYTLEHTTLMHTRPGDLLNAEVDTLCRYVHAYLKAHNYVG